MTRVFTFILLLLSVLGAMAQRTHELPEVVVVSKGREVLHLTGYVREYSTLTTYSDTVTLFREKMVDFMVPTKHANKYNGWLTPRVLGVKSFYRFSNYTGLDSVSDYFSRHFSWADLIGITKEVYLPKKLYNGDGCDTIRGRYGDASRWRRTADDVSVRLDVLADTTCYQWVPYITTFMHHDTEFDKMIVNYHYTDIQSALLSPGELSGMTFDIETSGRGRPIFGLFKPNEPIFVSTHAELYITDREYLSVKQAHKLEKAEIGEVAIESPAGLAPLSPEILNLIARVESIDHLSRHVAITGDKKLAGIKDLFSTRRSTWQKIKDIISPPTYQITPSLIPR